MSFTIRAATVSDAKGILEIYAPIVKQTPISFETEVPDEPAICRRISDYSDSHAFLISEFENKIAGYAYGSFFRPREAYKNSAEVTIYVHKEARGQGVARSLYKELLVKLSEKHFHTALAGIALPNEASIALHRSLGFEQIGVFRDVGFKFDKWHDVEWWQKPLIKTPQGKL